MSNDYDETNGKPVEHSLFSAVPMPTLWNQNQNQSDSRRRVSPHTGQRPGGNIQVRTEAVQRITPATVGNG